MSTMIQQAGLSSALFGKTRQAVLGLLYSRPDEAFYVREVTRAAGAGQGSVQRELKRLLDAGLIVRVNRGRQVYYQANRACPIFAELHGLVLKTAGLADVLRAALSPVAGRIAAAFVYGSQAIGTATGASDIDLLVVGDPDELALHKAITQAEVKLGRSVNYTLIDQREFARRRKQRKQKEGFLARVLGGKKIPILGALNEV